MSDHLGEKKLTYSAHAITILALLTLVILLFVPSLGVIGSCSTVECFSGLFNFLHHSRNSNPLILDLWVELRPHQTVSLFMATTNPL